MPVRKTKRRTKRRGRRLRGGSVPESARTVAKSSALSLIRRPTGVNLLSKLGNLNTSLRQNRTISSFLQNHGMNRLSSFASMLGYGKRRRVGRPRKVGRPRRTLSGRGFFGDVWGGIKNVGRALAPTVANLAVKRLTGGRRRRRRVGRPRNTGRRMAGRGIFGKIAGGLLGSILPF